MTRPSLFFLSLSLPLFLFPSFLPHHLPPSPTCSVGSAPTSDSLRFWLGLLHQRPRVMRDSLIVAPGRCSWYVIFGTPKWHQRSANSPLNARWQVRSRSARLFGYLGIAAGDGGRQSPSNCATRISFRAYLISSEIVIM